MNQKYKLEIKKEIIRLYLEEGRTMKSLTEEYNLGKDTNIRKECDEQTNDSWKELRRLRKQNAELRNENDF